MRNVPGEPYIKYTITIGNLVIMIDCIPEWRFTLVLLKCLSFIYTWLYIIALEKIHGHGPWLLIRYLFIEVQIIVSKNIRGGTGAGYNGTRSSC